MSNTNSNSHVEAQEELLRWKAKGIRHTFDPELVVMADLYPSKFYEKELKEMTYSETAKLLGISVKDFCSGKAECPVCGAPFIYHGIPKNGEIGCPCDAPNWKPYMAYKYSRKDK